jgi:rod shape-determining protein MreD
MKLTGVLVTVFLAVTLQVTLARFTVGGRWVFDLVLVGVVYASLQWGRVAGMIAGTIGGLTQDLLSGGVVGVGGLAKTLVGFAAGTVGTQFVLVKPRARMLIVAVASIGHRLIMILTASIITQQWPGLPWRAILVETLINALAGLLVFHLQEALPAAVDRGRMSRRSTFTRRQW